MAVIIDHSSVVAHDTIHSWSVLGYDRLRYKWGVAMPIDEGLFVFVLVFCCFCCFLRGIPYQSTHVIHCRSVRRYVHTGT